MADALAQLRQAQPGLSRLVLIADQFEEAFTLCGDEKLRRSFLAALLQAAEAPWVTVILTLRADFYGRVLEDERLSKRVVNGLVSILPMTPEERRAAIEQPALPAGRRFEEGLVQRILDAIADAPGDLPLLEFALTELWDHPTADGMLTHAAYDAIGEVKGAIATRADDLLTHLKKADPQNEAAVRTIFTRLVKVARSGQGADTKLRIAQEALPPQAVALVSQLVDARLLMTDFDRASQKKTVEVAHEALIRGWPQLQEWVNRDREFLLRIERLRTLMEIWERSGRSEGALLRDALLREAQGLSAERAGDLSATELTFIRESELAAERAEQEKEAARQRELDQASALAAEQQRRAEAEQQRAETAESLAAEQTAHAEDERRAKEKLRQRARYLAVLFGIAIVAGLIAAVSAGLAQAQLGRQAGLGLLQEAYALKEKGDALGAIEKFRAAQATQTELGIDVETEIADVRRKVATDLAREGEAAAKAGDFPAAEAKFKAALALAPPPDTPVYVYVPAGEFVMGEGKKISCHGDPCLLDPAH